MVFSPFRFIYPRRRFRRFVLIFKDSSGGFYWRSVSLLLVLPLQRASDTFYSIVRRRVPAYAPAPRLFARICRLCGSFSWYFLPFHFFVLGHQLSGGLCPVLYCINFTTLSAGLSSVFSKKNCTNFQAIFCETCTKPGKTNASATSPTCKTAARHRIILYFNAPGRARTF